MYSLNKGNFTKMNKNLKDLKRILRLNSKSLITANLKVKSFSKFDQSQEVFILFIFVIFCCVLLRERATSPTEAEF